MHRRARGTTASPQLVFNRFVGRASGAAVARDGARRERARRAAGAPGHRRGGRRQVDARAPAAARVAPARRGDRDGPRDGERRAVRRTARGPRRSPAIHAARDSRRRVRGRCSAASCRRFAARRRVPRDEAPLDPLQGHQLLGGARRVSARRERGAAAARSCSRTCTGRDIASWDALEYVLAQLTTERICIALTIRSEEAAYGAVRERRQRLSRDERVRELRLERLTAARSARVAAGRAAPFAISATICSTSCCGTRKAMRSSSCSSCARWRRRASSPHAARRGSGRFRRRSRCRRA